MVRKKEDFTAEKKSSRGLTFGRGPCLHTSNRHKAYLSFSAGTAGLEGVRCGEGENARMPLADKWADFPLGGPVSVPYPAVVCGTAPVLSRWYPPFSSRASPARRILKYAPWAF